MITRRRHESSPCIIQIIFGRSSRGTEEFQFGSKISDAMLRLDSCEFGEDEVLDCVILEGFQIMGKGEGF